MVNLMKKTKRQLVELIQNLEREKAELQKKLAPQQEPQPSQAHSVSAPQTADPEFERVTRINENLKNGYSGLADAHDQLIRENGDLVRDREFLERKMEGIENLLDRIKKENINFQKEVGMLAARLEQTDEVLKVFTDSGDKGIVLLDQDFKIFFTNGPAGRYLRLEDAYGSGNPDFLSFICGEDPQKIEKKFQKAIRKNKKGKFKKMSLSSGPGTMEKVHIKFLPILYKDRPGLQLVIE